MAPGAVANHTRIRVLSQSRQNAGQLTLTGGSEAHIEGVMQVTLRAVIDEIDRIINSLEESLLDVSFETEIRPDPSYFTEEDKP